MRRSTLYFFILVIAVLALAVILPLSLRRTSSHPGENYPVQATSLGSGRHVNAITVNAKSCYMQIMTDSAATEVKVEITGENAASAQVSYDSAGSTLSISADTCADYRTITVTLPPAEPLTAIYCGDTLMTLSLSGLDTPALSIAGGLQSIDIAGSDIGLLAIGSSEGFSFELNESLISALTSMTPMDEVSLDISRGSTVGSMIFGQP